MVTFKGEPNLLVRFNPPIGTVKYARFDENGEYSTENERIIKRFYHKFDSIPSQNAQNASVDDEVSDDDKVFKCKKCDYTTPNKGDLMAHYRKDHPKED